MIPSYLSSHGIKVAVLSLDDLYLPHAGLVSLASLHPDNLLLRGRGQPGTHDIALGLRCLEALKGINEEGREVELPVFDKSRFGGEGDRSSETTRVRGQIDIVMLEGWMMGFYPLNSADLSNKYALKALSTPPTDGTEPPFFLAHKLDHLQGINKSLKEYAPMWSYFDCFVQMRPVDMSYTWQWRLEVR